MLTTIFYWRMAPVLSHLKVAAIAAKEPDHAAIKQGEEGAGSDVDAEEGEGGTPGKKTPSRRSTRTKKADSTPVADQEKEVMSGAS